MRHKIVRTGNVVVSAVGTALLLVGVLTAQEKPDLDKVLSRIELRYNRLATLRVDFEQTQSYLGRRPRHEKGELSLYRPMKMRWDYSKPEGKILVGDGEVLRMYSPLTNQVTQTPMDETGDLRAPLSFLLGRLKFRKQFRNLRIEEIDGRRVVVGEGRPQKDPYGRVEFTYDPQDFRLTRIKVYSDNETVTTFQFRDEEINPRLDASLFVFRAPSGAEVVADSTPAGSR